MSRRLALALTLALLAPASSRAQVGDSTTLRIRAARRDTIRATSTVTAAFTVANSGSDSVSVMPHIEMPRDWTILMGGSALPVAGRSSEMLMLSVVVPARAAAGVFPVRVWITTSRDPKGVMDSIVVRVPERRALDISLLDRPGYVVSGRNYRATFEVRNRGNAPAQIQLTLGGTLSAATMSDTSFMLAPEESRVVTATARTRAGLQSAIDDVLEVIVKQPGGDEPMRSSVRVTVVPEPTRKIEEFLRLPVRANLRASNGGVAPYEISGSGLVVDGSRIRTDFLFRGKPSDLSAFGERDEYRLLMTAPQWQARLGDNFYMLSPLTGGAQPGMGASLSGDIGRFSGTGYTQRFRRDPAGGTESGASIGAYPFAGARVGLNAVTRAGGLMPANVGSATAAITRGIYHGDAELARSSGSSASGMARTARLGASTSRASFDLGHSHADTSFAGVQRGADHNYFSGNLAAFDNVAFAVNASRHESDLSRATGVPYVEKFDVALLSTTLYETFTLELNSLRRATTISGLIANGTQRGVRAHADLDVPFVSLSAEAEVGQSANASLIKRRYTDARLSVRRRFRGGGTVALWTGRYSGGSLTKGDAGAITLGGDASWRMGVATNVTVLGYATRPEIDGQEWHSQAELLAARALPNGASLTLRVRKMGGGATVNDKTLAFLEYGMPLRLPVSRLRTAGRVHGRVVDATTGSGIPGALVRLGPQIAITDSRGDVAFGGVPAGEHRLSMSQETSFADAVFVGDPTLLVDSTRTRPTEFRLAIARSARINISARRYAARQTAIVGSAAGASGAASLASRDSSSRASRDSLVDAGPLANATLVLTSESDTLYRMTRNDGTATFTDVPPGVWSLAIRGDAPAHHRFEPDRLELVLKPGETQEQSFRLIPRRREVQIIGEGQELKSTTAESKTQSPGSGVKTVKPEEKKDRQDKQ